MRSLLKEREKAGGDLASALKRARRRLPRRIYRIGLELAAVQPLLEHPKLRLTVQDTKLLRQAEEIITHLRSIDLADRRRGRILDILGSMAFALLTATVLLLILLRWRGFL
ncbi:hypothetical protein [Phaeobacter sp.]|uniref:hypothetical protein n=1 Tax=Phaeobacter sp. TaxID=1902409 RepID=UPI0025DF89C0|nr:hypothetical protein [Phaeobacter sp.]